MAPATIDDPDRFAFGANWERFLSVLDSDRIAEAEHSLQVMLGVDDLVGKTFLDIGSGSGLFSLAARRLGARVHSFDFDPQSVACTRQLKRLHFPDDDTWQIDQASALDGEYLSRLGRFDVVYSWGVLHHTGAMWLGIENALQRVGDGGRLFLAIYNDQGLWSRVWWLIKHFYNRLPGPLRKPYAYTTWYAIVGLNILKYTIMLKPMAAIKPLLSQKRRRGMSTKHDIIDWIGGLPFEYVSYEVLIEYMKHRGFVVAKGIPNHGIGCHQVVFEKIK